MVNKVKGFGDNRVTKVNIHPSSFTCSSLSNISLSYFSGIVKNNFELDNICQCINPVRHSPFTNINMDITFKKRFKKKKEELNLISRLIRNIVELVNFFMCYSLALLPVVTWRYLLRNKKIMTSHCPLTSSTRPFSFSFPWCVHGANVNFPVVL